MALDPELSLLSYGFDGTISGEFTSAVSQYEQEHIEGPFRASWVFEEKEGDVTQRRLRSWFYGRLMSQVVVTYKGERVWHGYIWEMQLEIGKLVLKRDMTDVANAVSAFYEDEDEDESVYIDFSETALPYDENDNIWALANESITQFGRHEIVLDSNGSEDEALALAKVALKKSPDPYSKAVVYKPLSKARLSITAVGRMVVANKIQLLDDRLRYHPDYEKMVHGEKHHYGIQWNVGLEIKRIVDVVQETGGWLYEVKIAENDTPTMAGSDSTIGAFDRLVELASLTNLDGDHYRLQVLDDGGVVYGKLDEEPTYVLKTADVGVEYFDGTIPKWQARPGIILNIAGRAGPTMPTSWLDDDRKIPIERVTMREGDEFASFNSREINELDTLSEFQAHIRWYKED